METKGDFAAIVRLNPDCTGDVFVVPTSTVDKKIRKDFKEFVQRGVDAGKWDKNDKTKTHTHRQLAFKSTKNKKGASELWDKYKNNWDSLLKCIKQLLDAQALEE